MLLGVCFICELVDSGLGMDYGTILTPTLLLIGYQEADIVPTILSSELFSGFTAAFFHNNMENVDLGMSGTDLKPTLILAGGSVSGVTVGVFLAMSVPEKLLKLLIGCIIFPAGFFVVLSSRKVVKYQDWKMLGLASVASFNKAVSGGGYGPLVTSGQILSGVKGKSAVGIISFAEAITCLVAMGLFLASGGYITLRILLPMCTRAQIWVPLLVFAINKAKEDHLRMVIGILTMSMGALPVYKLFNEYGY